jgi:hypothetical protein
MSLYRVDGSPTFQGARPPAMIADFEAQCVRLWRFQSHVLRPIFVGSDVPNSLSIDPRHLTGCGKMQCLGSALYGMEIEQLMREGPHPGRFRK